MMGGMCVRTPEDEAAAGPSSSSGELLPPIQQQGHSLSGTAQQQAAAAVGAAVVLPAAAAGDDASPLQEPTTAATTNPKDAPPSTWRRDAHFMMNHFKVLPCQRRTRHQWRSCPFVHPGEAVRRRSLLEVSYSAVMCAYIRLGQECPAGEACANAHNVFELWLHPARFRTQLCSDGTSCRRSICFFAHGTHELRSPELGAACGGGPAAFDMTTTLGSSVGPPFAFDGTVTAVQQQQQQQQLMLGGGVAVHHHGLGVGSSMSPVGMMGAGNTTVVAAPYVTATSSYAGPSSMSAVAPPPLPTQFNGQQAQPPQYHQQHPAQQQMVLARDAAGSSVPYLMGPAAFGGNGTATAMQWAQLAATTGGVADSQQLGGLQQLGGGVGAGGAHIGASALPPAAVMAGGAHDPTSGLWGAPGNDGYPLTTAPLQLMSLLNAPEGQELLHTTGSPTLPAVLPARMAVPPGALMSTAQGWQQLPAVMHQQGSAAPQAHNPHAPV